MKKNQPSFLYWSFILPSINHIKSKLKLEISGKSYLKTFSLSTSHLPLWLEHPFQACSLSSLPCCSQIPSKTDFSYLWTDCEKQDLNKHKNHVVHVSYWTQSCPQLLSSLPFSYICERKYLQHLIWTEGLFLPVVQGTWHGLGSSKAINEIKPIVTMRTDCLMSDVQTGSSNEWVCMNKY